MDPDRRTGDMCRYRKIDLSRQRSDDAPDERALPLLVVPRMKMVGDSDRLEPGFLSHHGLPDEVIRTPFLAGQEASELGSRQVLQSTGLASPTPVAGTETPPAGQTVAHGGAEGHRRGRRSKARAVQPRQGPVSGIGHRESGGGRLLHPDRPGPAAPPRRPAADPEAMARRRRGSELLREERTTWDATLGADGDPAVAGKHARTRDRHIRRLQRLAHLGVAGEPRRPGDARPTVAGPRRATAQPGPPGPRP